ncbi:Bax inhibitor-1/YccA family protein [Brevibacterium album]|uniref:Bax inhibitor-1/YccA family protein n=1 Tax=Brevibacterium album TaxID=417948 RepID=UPI000428BBF6|nr:Bax inhibitor-1/YccA family protein [Brevibacterium album]
MSNPLVRRGLNEGIKAGQTPNRIPAPAPEDLQSMYDAPSYQPQQPAAERAMTYDDVLMKSGMCFAVLLAGAVIGWIVPVLAFPAMLVGLVLGLIVAFKKEPSPALVLVYAAVQGAFLGGISVTFEALYPGIVMQAVLGTLSVFFVMFGLFKFKIIRMSSGFMKFLMLAVGGYAVFSLVNFGFAMFSGGAMNARTMEISIMGITMPLGVLISGVAVILAALTLVSDFHMIEEGVKHRIPEKYSWVCAFSIMVTLIWLYIEILRLLSYFRQN